VEGVSAGHYENFPVASLAVPARLRRAVLAIYAFARMADDIADEGDDAPAARLDKLAACDAALDAIAVGRAVAEPPYPELARALREHALPIAPFHELVSAFRQDVTTSRYATYALLLDYCRRSANPIGRLLLQLFDVRDAARLAQSDAICTALQLVNFWQDVASDWKRGRVYLPQEDLARFGVAEPGIAAWRCDDAWRALMAFETARTRALMISGRPLLQAFDWRLRLEISGVIAGGLRILELIDAVEGDVFRRRPRLGRADWMRVGWRALFPQASSSDGGTSPLRLPRA